jgi:hypothetical protein
MKKVMLVLMLLLVVFAYTACDSSSGIAGEWKCTKYSFVGNEKGEEFLNNTKLIIKKDGTMMAIVNGKKQTGTYKELDDKIVFKAKLGFEVEYIKEGNILKISNPALKAEYKK